MTLDERTEHEIVRAAVSGAMTPDEAVAARVLAGVMAGCFGNPPHDATAFRWRVVQAIAAALQAEREACAQIVADVRGRWGVTVGERVGVARALRGLGGGGGDA